jgi:S-methylmethionine-dependent homocysteine/selenocysteine methylase/SAM-dependent methyltransferase
VSAAARAATTASPGYRRVERRLAEQRCVTLDGATATELSRAVRPAGARGEDRAWATWALLEAPDAVLGVHRAYAEVGCDVISTNTWGIAGERAGAPPADWMEMARRGVRVGRRAIAEAGRADDVALAFAINGDVADARQQETLALLTRVFEDDPPDLVLLETMTLVRDELTFATVELMLATGLPVWLSFRRCRHGPCGVYGQHWGGPEGDGFGRAARRFEELGASALLLNCLPPDHVPGMLPWLRDFTDLPLGVYPNLGYATTSGWSSNPAVGPAEYAELAAQWRAEGAQIVGGCCGVGPAHVAAARERLAGSRPGGAPAPAGGPTAALGALEDGAGVREAPVGWTDAAGRELFPLPVPEIVCEPGVFVPTQGSFLVWRHLFREDLGAGLRCLDVGCGSGLLAVQLALNGAERVHAIDVERRAVRNTLANAFRNGVAERVTGATVDLYPWVPEERYDLVVASLYQMPVDPFERPGGQRPPDFWGRSLLDHLLGLLPRLLAPGGRAYVMQLSILGQRRTAALLERHGLAARVVDFTAFPFTAPFERHRGQIERAEELSDAYHLTFAGGDDDGDVMVAYLLEITTPARPAVGQRRG